MRSPERDPAHGRPPAGDAPAAVATILVCTACRGPDGAEARPRPGERLLAAAARLAGDDAGNPAEGAAPVAVRGVECLGNCKRRLSAAVLAPGAWAYVFGDLDETAGADLLAGARLLAGAADGLMPWRGRPDALKRGLVARLPPSLPLATPDTP